MSTRPRASWSSTANLKGNVLTGYVDRVAVNQAIADARRRQHQPGHHGPVPARRQPALQQVRARLAAGRCRPSAARRPSRRVRQARRRARPELPPQLARRPPGPSGRGLKNGWYGHEGREAARRRLLKAGKAGKAARPHPAGEELNAKSDWAAWIAGSTSGPHRCATNRWSVDSALVDRERFTEHLAAPYGRGFVPPGPTTATPAEPSAAT